jgi:hypothetical protein
MVRLLREERIGRPFVTFVENLSLAASPQPHLISVVVATTCATLAYEYDLPAARPYATKELPR